MLSAAAAQVILVAALTVKAAGAALICKPIPNA